MLNVIRGGNGTPSDRRDANFTGEAWRDVVLAKTDGVSVGNVFFAPCARTFWHTHEGGQLLLVTAGQGIVADDDGPVLVTGGDMVWTPPGVRHWHGATSSRFMLHTAITIGAADWHDAVTDDEYEAHQPQ